MPKDAGSPPIDPEATGSSRGPASNAAGESADGGRRQDPDVSDRFDVLSLEGLSVAGVTRRRAAFVLAAALTIWIVVVFARQVGDATAAGVRADRMRSANESLAAQVQELQREKDLIQRQAYIELAARAYDLGGPQERPFAISPDASPLPADAPGSAANRLGAHQEARSPLDSWLTILFGPPADP